VFQTEIVIVRVTASPGREAHHQFPQSPVHRVRATRSIRCEETFARGGSTGAEEAGEQREGLDARGGGAAEEGAEVQHAHPRGRATPEATPGAVRQKANSLGLSTKPTNKSPYGTGGKRRGR
jgi:hypothetical protein